MINYAKNKVKKGEKSFFIYQARNDIKSVKNDPLCGIQIIKEENTGKLLKVTLNMKNLRVKNLIYFYHT